MTKSFQPTAANLVFVNSTVQLLDGLRSNRETWEATDYKKANDGLYSLLAECLAVFSSSFVTASVDDRKAMRAELVAKLTASGIKVQRNTATITMFVRFVFGSGRNRAHGYANVLKAAISHNIDAINLASWIAEQGGIEQIKRNMVVSEKALANKAELNNAKSEVVANIERAVIQPLAQVQLDGVVGEHAVLLAKPNPDGTVSIIGVVSNVNEAMYNALLMRMAKKTRSVNAENAALNKEAIDLLGANDDTFSDPALLQNLA